jgi:hypothetical protein
LKQGHRCIFESALLKDKSPAKAGDFPLRKREFLACRRGGAYTFVALEACCREGFGAVLMYEAGLDAAFPGTIRKEAVRRFFAFEFGQIKEGLKAVSAGKSINFV